MPNRTFPQPLTGPEIIEVVLFQTRERHIFLPLSQSASRSMILFLLDAIREPPAGVIDAGQEVIYCDCGKDIIGGSIADGWRAMIDRLRREIAG